MIWWIISRLNCTAKESANLFIGARQVIRVLWFPHGCDGETAILTTTRQGVAPTA